MLAETGENFRKGFDTLNWTLTIAEHNECNNDREFPVELPDEHGQSYEDIDESRKNVEEQKLEHSIN